jgi:hypothetical protein
MLEVVITEDGGGYYLSDGNDECDESAEWGVPIEFKGVSYLADVDESGEHVTLAKVIDIAEGSFEVVSEGDSDEETEEAGG